jgi:ankyrin repeat protein
MAAAQEWYELRNLCRGKKFEEAAVLLQKNPSLRNAVNGIGETVLHYLAVENDQEGISWLVKNGFDINTQNEFGTPAIFEVAQLDYKELLAWFIANGANLKCRDKAGNNIKEFIVDFGNEKMVKHLESLGL